jgi:hypothetical protein
VWCFFDESYQQANGGVTAIAACLMNDHTVRGLDLVLYNARRKHFGRDHAKDLTKELKGSALLSSASFRQMEKFGNNRNHDLASQIFRDCVKFRREHPIWIFGSVVYGALGVLTRLGTHRLVRPVTDILDKVSAAACAANHTRRVNLVFDNQICGQEPAIAAAVRRFVSGVGLPNVSHYPLIGVSHVSPGIQLADICAFILGRRAVGDSNFDPWLNRMQQLEWVGTVNGYPRTGIQRWEEDIYGKLAVCPWK